MTPSTHTVRFESATSLTSVPDRSIHLVVTSPPYPMIAMWDALFAGQSTGVSEALSAEDGSAAFEWMHQCLDPVWAEVERVLVDGGIACINIGDAVRTVGGIFSLYPNHARILTQATRLGLTALPAILWRKPTNAPTKFMGSGMMPPGAYVTLEHEYILVFRKGGARQFVSETDRERRRTSAYFWEERNAWFSDVWLDLKGVGQEGATHGVRHRSAAFPFELPYRLITMFSAIGDTVLDPFLGIGTTMMAAAAAGRNSIGYEIDPALAGPIQDRMADVGEIANHRMHHRIETHRSFVADRQQQGRPCRHHNHPHAFPVMTKQERDLRIVPVADFRATGSNAFSVKYADAPPADWQGTG